VKNIGEGGKIMQEEIVETTVATEAEAEVVTKSETVEETAVEAVVETVADATEEVVKAEVVEEVASDESDLVKMITELRSLVEKTVTEKTSENAEALAAIAKSVSDNSAEFTAALTDVIAKQSEMAEVIASLSTALESVAKTVTVIDEADAIKKSGDLGRSTEQVTKSNIWSGAFLVRS
jgi:hydroxylamine reductase (hybrid-cluster protein)